MVSLEARKRIRMLNYHMHELSQLLQVLCEVWGWSRGVIVKAMQVCSKRVRTPVVLLRSISDKYPWKSRADEGRCLLEDLKSP